MSPADTISSSKLAGKHELIKGILLGEKTEDQQNLRTKPRIWKPRKQSTEKRSVHIPQPRDKQVNTEDRGMTKDHSEKM